MPRQGLLVAALLVVVAGGACSSGKRAASSGPTTGPVPTLTSTSTSAPAATVTTAPPSAPGVATLSVTDVRLFNSEESDNALRMLIDSTAPEVTVTVSGGIPSPNRVIYVCPAADLNHRGAPASACTTPASGEAVKVAHGAAYKGVEVVQVGVSSGGVSGGSTAISEITVAYAPTSRQVQVRMPPLPEGEAGGRPAFRLTPVGSGAYEATAAFSALLGAQGEAELVLAAGSSTMSTARGPAPSLSGNLSPPVDATFRLRNSGSVTLTALSVTVLFP